MAYKNQAWRNPQDEEALTEAIKAAAFGDGPEEYRGVKIPHSLIVDTRSRVAEESFPNRSDPRDRTVLDSSSAAERAHARQSAGYILDDEEED